MAFEKTFEDANGRQFVARTPAEANDLQYGHGYREVTGKPKKAENTKPNGDKATKDGGP